MIICCCGTATCTINPTGRVVDCGGTGLSGYTVVVSDNVTGAVYWTGTSNSTGNYTATLAIPTGGTTVKVTVSSTSSGALVSASYTIAVTCASTSLSAFTVVSRLYQFEPPNCGVGVIPNATIVVTGTLGVSTLTLSNNTPPGTGLYYPILLTPGTYTWSCAAPRYTTVTGTLVVPNSCHSGNLVVPANVPASGYACLCYVDYPVPTTVNGSWSGGGTFTGTYAGGSWTWSVFSATFPGDVYPSQCCFHAFSTGTFSAKWNQCTTGSGSLFDILFDSVSGNNCPIPVGTAGSVSLGGGWKNSSFATDLSTSSFSSTPPLSGSVTLHYQDSGGTCDVGGTVTFSE